nr:hypothetical protein [Mucilaginibacter sp. FT3.2]
MYSPRKIGLFGEPSYMPWLTGQLKMDEKKKNRFSEVWKNFHFKSSYYIKKDVHQKL